MTLRWQSRSRPVASRKACRMAFAGGVIGLGFLALSLRTGVPAILYNPSPSAPIGYYRTLPATPLTRGDWVAAFAPDDARRLADTRHYLPASVPMIKQVAALTGDRVCAMGPDIAINGQRVVTRLRTDHLGRLMPWWTGCRTVGATEVFLLNAAAPASFDGRYFGVVSQGHIIARAVPL